MKSVFLRKSQKKNIYLIIREISLVKEYDREVTGGPLLIDSNRNVNLQLLSILRDILLPLDVSKQIISL